MEGLNVSTEKSPYESIHRVLEVVPVYMKDYFSSILRDNTQTPSVLDIISRNKESIDFFGDLKRLRIAHDIFLGASNNAREYLNNTPHSIVLRNGIRDYEEVKGFDKKPNISSILLWRIKEEDYRFIPEILLVRKTKGDNSFYYLPGGKIEQNEDAKEALARELSEELPGFDTSLVSQSKQWIVTKSQTPFVGTRREVVIETNLLYYDLDSEMKYGAELDDLQWIDSNANLSPAVLGTGLLDMGLVEDVKVAENTQFVLDVINEWFVMFKTIFSIINSSKMRA